MSCRLPGGLTTPQQLWDFIIGKGDARSKVPNSRYNVDAFHSHTAKPGAVRTEYGYFLDDSVDLGALDTSFFSMQRADLEATDPQERLMLELTRECVEDAGVTDWHGRNIGCYIGNFGEDWLEISNKESQRWGGYKTADFMISNRISYEMGWRGPSMTVRTGCSAALVGLNEACLALARGDCEAALVGGSNLIMTPSLTSLLSTQEVLSKDGSCKTFSADADGYGRGEALVAVYIKPLRNALRDGNPIRAVIRATGTNHDGKTQGIFQPSTEAQEALIRQTYQSAAISDFGETAMVECHGTGTPTGDPIETKAVARVFGQTGVYIGSVKPNVGHSEGASGLTSLIKMVLALEHRTIPPNIKFKTPNPKIPFHEGNLVVPTDPIPWPQDRLERVSINCFGVGGTNAHVILESADRFLSQEVPSPVTSPQLLLYSATTSKSLITLSKQYQEWLAVNYRKVGDLASTLAHRRTHHPLRTFAIAHDGIIEQSQQPSFKPSPNHKVVMVFTGQGAQWQGMGRELLQNEEVFRNTIRSLDQHLKRITRGSISYSIEKELFKASDESCLHLASISQPVCTAIQIALIDTLKSLDVNPHAVVGHSSGEIAAAYAAGALDASEAIAVAHYRGVVAESQKKKGSMAAIGLSTEQVGAYIRPGVTFACHNSPNNVTISGDTSAINDIVADIQSSVKGVSIKVLPVDKAYHSPHMAEVGKEYHLMIKEKICPRKPHVPFFSSVTGRVLEDDRQLSAQYWQDNLELPVLFREATGSILQDYDEQDIIFLEIGPHSALAAPLRQTCKAHSTASYQYIASMRRNCNTAVTFLTAIGTLCSLGVPIRLDSIIPRRRCLPDLPRYPWNHDETYWAESRLSKDWRFRKHKYHNLLGVRVPESTDLEPAWRNLLHIQNVPWMRDHRVGDNIVFPFTGYLSIVGEAIRQVSGEELGYSVRDISVDIAMVVDEGSTTEVVTTFRPHYLSKSQESSWWDFTITSFNNHVWTRHCKGQVRSLASALPPIHHSNSPLPKKVDVPALYRGMQRAGVNLGPSFQIMPEIEVSTASDNSARASTTCRGVEDEADYYIHPTMLDVIFQLPIVAAVNGRIRLLKNWIPVSVEKLSVLRCKSDIIGNLSSKRTSNGSLRAEGHCVSSDGTTVVEVSGVRLSPADGSTSSEIQDTHGAARLEWAPSLDYLSEQDLMRLIEGQKRLCPLTFLQYLSHLHPNLRILEVGMGSSSLLDDIEDHLTSSKSRISLSKFTSALLHTRDRGSTDFKTHEVEHTALDIEGDLDAQGFGDREFDFIMIRKGSISSDHTGAILQNLEKIINPGGRVFIEEAPEIWKTSLKRAVSSQNGHSGHEDSSSGRLGSWLSCNTDLIIGLTDLQHLTGKADMHNSAPSYAKQVTFLRSDLNNPPTTLMKHFQCEGYMITQCTLSDRLLPGQDVISLLDEEKPFFEEITKEQYDSLNMFLQMLQDNGLLWITQHSQMGCSDPRYSQVVGLARTLRSEMQLDFATCEIDSFESDPELLVRIYEQYRKRRQSETIKPEFEYAIQDGVVHCGRYHPFSLKDQMMVPGLNDRIVLDVDIPGRLNTLRWAKLPRERLGPNDIEIEVHAVGLNFKDVTVAMGIIELPTRQLGLEAAGIVTRVGEGVETAKVGDRVCCMHPHSFSSIIVSPEDLCTRMPDAISFDEAATMLISFATVIHSLVNIARLEQGQSVLIHSACGGVGLAAIQVAKMIGAEIYATVGTDDKAAYLVENYGIPRNRIFDSRSSSFVDGVMRETSNKGVDVVLNSLSGELLHASWECVAEFGTLIELGRRDLLHGGKLDMRPFIANRNYCCVGLDQLLTKAGIRKRLIRSIFQYYEEGHIKPIHPIRVFEASQVQSAFQTMQKGTHIGRFSISMAASLTCDVKPRLGLPKFEGDASFLLVGGTGGIGRALSTFMAENGAQELIFLSRSAGIKPADMDLSVELESMGCSVIFVSGDVCDEATISSALLKATRPIRGIVQLSMVLRDQNFSDMTFEQWTEAAAPKIKGTWNLHHTAISQAIDLDFFVLCGSISGHIGQPGQANYASANTFLDSFAQYRNNLGLAASVIDIGAVEDVGVLARNTGLLTRMKADGLHALSEQELLDAFVYAMFRPKPSTTFQGGSNSRYCHPNSFLVGLGPLVPPTVRKKDRRMAVFSKDTSDEKELVSNEPLKDLLAAADERPAVLRTDEAARILSIEIGKKIADMLLLQPEVDVTAMNVLLRDLGMDSLVAVELRAWWRQVFRLDISVREILGTGTLGALGKLAADGLLKART
ncbi:acyl transferase domain-containing protein [Xylaria flabelliformis]|nr:acyl transferase domain-containing protein [Xylaria flabelliformis]